MPANYFPFTITTSITREEYIKLMRQLAVRNKNTWLSQVFLFLMFGFIYYLAFLKGRELHWIADVSPLFVGLAFFYFLRKRKAGLQYEAAYNTNPRIQHPVEYSFRDDTIMISGLGFKSELSWSSIIDLKELPDFILLYPGARMIEPVRRSSLTEEQILVIKSKLHC